MLDVHAFLSALPHDGPCVAVSLARIVSSYKAFASTMPDAQIFYAVKANPAPEILKALVGLSGAFDCASIGEIEMALAAGAAPQLISFGNTIKRETDVVRAFALGVRLFAVDDPSEVEKVARAAPGAGVFCRILLEGAQSDWPLSRKFGRAPQTALPVLIRARDLGLQPRGISFHVGSQQRDPLAWDGPISVAAAIFRDALAIGIRLDLLNLGGGFPATYDRTVPDLDVYAAAIEAAMEREFGAVRPMTIIEPGRGLVGDAGILRAQVLLVSDKGDGGPRWVFLDIGRFGGLAETQDEAIRYSIERERRTNAPLEPMILAGPTCDSADVLYERVPYPLPADIRSGDVVLIHGTGAYTTTYSAVAFNGLPPLAQYVVPLEGDPELDHDFVFDLETSLRDLKAGRVVSDYDPLARLAEYRASKHGSGITP